MDPNFFIVGGAKCGTTNMSYNLMEHEEIFMPKLNEPYYFCRLDVPNDFQRNSMIKDKTNCQSTKVYPSYFRQVRS